MEGEGQLLMKQQWDKTVLESVCLQTDAEGEGRLCSPSGSPLGSLGLAHRSMAEVRRGQKT